jgi:hypothetical protein
MAHSIGRKNWIMIVIGVLSIVGLLSYTWIHSGNLLASYVNPPFVGFLAALGIELSIVGLSMRIGELKKSGLDYRFFAFTLIAVVVVSAVANIAEGFMVKYGEALTIGNIGKLDLVEAFILLAATGLISLVTLALSEIIGQDVIQVQKAQKKAEQSETKPGGYTIVPNPVEEIASQQNPQLEAPKTLGAVPTDDDFRNMMDALGGSAPQSIAGVMSMFNMSHATAQRRLAKYRDGKS